MEQLKYNLSFRWFVGLGVDAPVWIPTVFTKNRDRLLAARAARPLQTAPPQATPNRLLPRPTPMRPLQEIRLRRGHAPLHRPCADADPSRP